MDTWTKTADSQTPPAPTPGWWYRQDTAIGVVMAHPETGEVMWASVIGQGYCTNDNASGYVRVMYDRLGLELCQIGAFKWADADMAGPTRESLGSEVRPIRFSAAEIGRAMDDMNTPVIG